MTVLKMSHFCLKYEKGLSHLALEIWLEHRIGRERLVYKQFLWIRFTWLFPRAFIAARGRTRFARSIRLVYIR